MSFFAQNEMAKWYFGFNAGLDFMTNPPTILTNGALNPSPYPAGEGVASISNSTGSLLFYTDGSTIWDQTHSVMANGSGLDGSNSASQGVVIVKQPGNNSLYVVFTTSAVSGPLKYSVVDMSLAAGMGSVTTKNIVLISSSTERVAAARHCNGIDAWVVGRSMGNTMVSYLVTSAGVNTVGVTTTLCCSAATWAGGLKLSPNGRKLAEADYGSGFYLYDFDNSTGLITNSLSLNNIGGSSAYSCEFSPDGTKLYGSQWINSQTSYQWDLCAGSNSAIVASQYVLSTSGIGELQLAPDGKIYGARPNQQYVGVINSPNLLGSACNYVGNGQSIAPKSCSFGLANFKSGLIIQPPVSAPFTHTVSYTFGCQTVSFTAPPTVQNFTMYSCSASGFSLSSFMWNFGDPASGATNTSALTNPVHAYLAPGTYTAQLILYYSCGGGTDTLKQVVNVNTPCVSVNSTSITCASLGSATASAIYGGSYSYTWMPGAQTGSIATNLSPGIYTLTVLNLSNNAVFTSTVNFISLIPLTGNINSSSSITCYGASTGTANVTALSGGSGNQYYLWTNGSLSYTTSAVNNLSAGIWSINVTDALTGCQINQSFLITQPPAMNLSVTASTNSLCLGGTVVLTGTNSGGTPGYAYAWINGPATATFTVNETTAGTYVYTLVSTDANSCSISATQSVDVVPHPLLAVANVSICPLQTATLSASGATSYTWTSATLSLSGSTFTDSPAATAQYTLVGEALGCYSQTNSSIFLKPVPNTVINTNSPRCNGDQLTMTAFGGVSFLWAGPNGFTSSLQSPIINTVSPLQSGVYTLTVTAVNNCTASNASTVVVNLTPTLSAVGASVCTNQTLSLGASSFTGSTYLWTGPQNYSSVLQNPSVQNPLTTSSGNYTVRVTSAHNCTNVSVVNVLVLTPPSLTMALSSNTLCEYAFNGSPNTITLTSSGANTYTLFTPFHLYNPNPNGPVSPIATQPPFSTGIATATLMGSNGVCTSVNTVSFSIIPNPTVTVSSPTPVICAGQSFTYTNQGAASYTWGPSSPGITTYSSGQVAVTHPSITSVFSVYGGSLGCNSAIQTTTITVNPLPLVGIVPGTPTICVNNSIQLSTTGNATLHTWTPHQGLNNTDGATVSAQPNSQQTYTVVGSLNSCTAQAVVTVSVLTLPSPSITVSKSKVCLNEPVSMEGSGGHVYNWYLPSGEHYEMNPLTFLIKNNSYAGNHTLTVTDLNGCKASTVTQITVYSLPDGSLKASKKEGCVPFLSDFTFYGSAQIMSSWQLNKEIFNTTPFHYAFTIPGQYVFIGRLMDTVTNCINTRTFSVNAYEVPSADFAFSPERPVEGLDEVVFTNSSRGEKQQKWNWYFINNNGYKSAHETTTYLFEQAGLYPIAYTVVNKWGCSDTVVKTVLVESDFSLYVPNVFTPNEDGLNEVFLPRMRGVRVYELSIFNRWGQMIYQTNTQEEGWNGDCKGELCKQDTYVWKIKLSTNSGVAKVFSGYVLLNP